MTKVPKRGVESKFSKPYFAALQSKLDRRAKAIQSRAHAAASVELEKPFEADGMYLDLGSAPIRSAISLEARNLAKSFEGRVLFEGISFDLARGEKMAVVGPNGAGKSTLLMGLLDPSSLDRGSVEWGLGVRVAQLAQIRSFGRHDSRTVLEGLEDLDPQRARDLLARLGLRGDFVLRKMEVLSVGERTRVELVRLLLCEANVLILDEPTNHLDLPSLETLEQALMQFQGSVIFACHDQRFVEKVADQALRL
ncbi:MAG TPA: ATP-binding cassette domain-containing protein [Fimbriimonas sp.]|nr:ATP-binding cassette domain-containing protein [Fimbriimonas sp.]